MHRQDSYFKKEYLYILQVHSSKRSPLQYCIFRIFYDSQILLPNAWNYKNNNSNIEITYIKKFQSLKLSVSGFNLIKSEH